MDSFDCNDNNADINPDALEKCNEIDDNCDGQIDEELTRLLYYKDKDGDGYGDPNMSKQDCMKPAGYVENGDDFYPDDPYASFKVDTWAKTFGGDDWDSAYSIQQTSDGGFIVAGKTYSFGAGKSDIWILKLDPSGNINLDPDKGAYSYDTNITPMDSVAIVSDTTATVKETEAKTISTTISPEDSHAIVYFQHIPE